MANLDSFSLVRILHQLLWTDSS